MPQHQDELFSNLTAGDALKARQKLQPNFLLSDKHKLSGKIITLTSQCQTHDHAGSI